MFLTGNRQKRYRGLNIENEEFFKKWNASKIGSVFGSVMAFIYEYRGYLFDSKNMVGMLKEFLNPLGPFKPQSAKSQKSTS